MIDKLYRMSLLLLAFLVLSGPLFALKPPVASAVSGSEWRAGNIISDATFFDYTSLDVPTIQRFLDSKVPQCDRNRAEYFTLYGKSYSPPWTCLKEYQENPNTKENNAGRFTANGQPYQVPGGMTAAQIIYHAANTYGISPKVLIVMLEKETSIVTDTWAAGWQYDRAMGYACPDSGPGGSANCNTSYYGFFNQVTNAAWQLKRYTVFPDSYNFKAGVTRNILWNVPAKGCGSSPVYLENSATAALYNYTPYQPNSAALNNLYGTGDNCSAYGNRNFWRLYNDWFGPTSGGSYKATVEAVSNTSAWLEYGETITSSVIVRNLGWQTWCADGSCTSGQIPTRLVSQNYAPMWLYDPSNTAWVNPAQIKMETPTVAPGQWARFTFRMKAPYVNNMTVSNRFFVNVGGSIVAPDANVWIGGHTYPTTAKVTSKSIPTTYIIPNQQVKAQVVIRNNSKTIWYSDQTATPTNRPLRLHVPGYQRSPFYDSSDPAWLTPSQIAMKTATVNPGQDAVFEFNLKGPFQQLLGYNQQLVPVFDGLAALPDIGAGLYLSTPAPSLSYSYQPSGSSYPSTMQKNTRILSTITIKNTSNTVWKNDASGSKNPTRLVMTSPNYRSSPFYDSSDPAWLTPSQIAMKTATVNPGQDAVFEFYWKAPATPQDYLEQISFVIDGHQFFPNYGSALKTKVTN